MEGAKELAYRGRGRSRGIGRAIGRVFRGGRGRGGGERGGGSSPTGLIVTVVMAVVAILLVIAIVPELEASSVVISPITGTMLNIVKWAIPVGAVLAVIIMIFRKVRGR